jgi:hypothetical protein
VAWRELKASVDRGEGLFFLEAKVCGLTVTEPSVSLRDARTRSASKSVLKVANPGWAPAASAACCDTSTCSGWQACSGNVCEARQCAGDADCGGSGHCVGAVCEAGPPSRGRTLLLAAGVALLALGAALLVWLQRRKRLRLEVEAAAIRAAAEQAELALKAEEDARAAAAKAAVSAQEELPETHLVVVAGPETLVGQRLRLARRSTTVGANGENGIVVAVPSVSGRHAEFQLFPTGALFVKDLESTNGVFVDGVRLSRGGRMELRAGAQVSLGQGLRLEVARAGAGGTRLEFDSAAIQASGAAAPPSKKRTVYDRGS